MGDFVLGRGNCVAPFLDLSLFPNNNGYSTGRLCAPVPGSNGTITCCLPCPITDWVYSDSFDAVSMTAEWLNVAGLVCCAILLSSYIVLPVKNTNRHYLTIGLVVAICLMQLGFVIPLGASPQQCSDAITPNDMFSDITCAFSGSFLLFGGFAAIVWATLRSISIHLQICWQVVPGKKFFWTSILAGCSLPAAFVAVSLAVTGVSYRFGSTCHINHRAAIADFWAPLLTLAAVSLILQFMTFAYCIKVYLKAMFEGSPNNSSTQASLPTPAPSHASRAESMKTVATARQAYRRIKKVIIIQWRGTAIVLLLVVNVVFLALVFMRMDSTVTSALRDFRTAQPWLFCLALHKGDKNKCLNEVQNAGLVLNEPTIAATLLLLSLNGLWALIFLGRTSMFYGWVELIMSPFRKGHGDFVSVDAKRFSGGKSVYRSNQGPTEHSQKHYEMMTSPSSNFSSIADQLPHESMQNFPVGQQAARQDEEAQIGLAIITPMPAHGGYLTRTTPSSTSSSHTALDANRMTTYTQPPLFASQEAKAQHHSYASSKLSFSTPRPPIINRDPGQSIYVHHYRETANQPETGTAIDLTQQKKPSTSTISTNPTTSIPSRVISPARLTNIAATPSPPLNDFSDTDDEHPDNTSVASSNSSIFDESDTDLANSCAAQQAVPSPKPLYNIAASKRVRTNLPQGTTATQTATTAQSSPRRSSTRLITIAARTSSTYSSSPPATAQMPPQPFPNTQSSPPPRPSLPLQSRYNSHGRAAKTSATVDETHRTEWWDPRSTHAPSTLSADGQRRH